MLCTDCPNKHIQNRPTLNSRVIQRNSPPTHPPLTMQRNKDRQKIWNFEDLFPEQFWVFKCQRGYVSWEHTKRVRACVRREVQVMVPRGKFESEWTGEFKPWLFGLLKTRNVHVNIWKCTWTRVCTQTQYTQHRQTNILFQTSQPQ